MIVMKSMNPRKFRMRLEDALEKVVAGRWIAGAQIRDAIARAEELNSRRESAAINYLGEGFTEKGDVAETVARYQRLIREIAHSGVDASISLKMTQLGLGIGRGLARRNYESLANLARRHGIFTWLDMEAYGTVDAALSVYERQLRKRGAVGICLQANLRRTEQDIRRLVEKGAVIRLVRGGYKENARVAFVKRKEVTDNYVGLMNYLFRNCGEFTIATHDRGIIGEAMNLNRSYRRKVTYGMSNGVGGRYAGELAGLGNRVSVYVPFGRRWKGYAYMKFSERGPLAMVLRPLGNGGSRKIVRYPRGARAPKPGHRRGGHKNRQRRRT
jgi:proline dehydrogenase